jgi:hypothetical protein
VAFFGALAAIAPQIRKCIDALEAEDEEELEFLSDEVSVGGPGAALGYL